MAFPAISTGAYGFPPQQAARIAVRQALLALENLEELRRIYFVCFSGDTRDAYLKALAEADRHGQ